MAVPERSLANLQPIRDSQRARDLNARSHAAKRARKADEARKQAEADDRSRQRLAELAYEALFQALQGEDVPVQARLTAAREALDRLEGKPTQRTETVQVEARPLAELSQEELLERAREAGLPVIGEPGAVSAPKAQSE